MNARSRSPAALLPALLLAVTAPTALAGCSSDASSPSGAANTASSVPTPSDGPSDRPDSGPDAATYPSYVALGDSYTAAPLVPETDLSEGCLRSSANYPALIAQAIAGTHLVDRSCSGADTTSLIGVQRTAKGPEPAQFDSLAEDTSLVTIGMGGNDFGLFSTLVETCTRLAEDDPTGSPCQDKLTAGGRDSLLAKVKKLGPRLTVVIAGIQGRSPHAEIVVVGYPQIIPTEGTCPDTLPLAEGDFPYAGDINAALAETQKRAAMAAGATYVNTYAASEGHDVCSDDPWVNGRVTDASVALAYHPLAVEQRAVADLVLSTLNRGTPQG